ncbi:MAG: 23S rRNA (uracil(1939)-C(5))-methyltransferase RlmD [Desulfovibrionaceae bacterium]|nr:23S rRNA (uracil(1939)-C(5))-methyltransferase RlmD [Desulfovibrionaceae bacterium]
MSDADQMPGETGLGAGLRDNDLVECAIESMAAGGRGLARVRGLAVFVDGAVPGQTVSARISRVRKRHAEAEVSEVLVRSPEQAEPFCPHFGTCGGCALQNMAYERQVFWKQRVVLDALERIGRQVPARVLPALACAENRRCRNKMEFSFEGRAKDLRLGLLERGAGRVVDIRDCLLASEQTVQVLDAARAYCRGTGLPAWDRVGGRGFWRRLVVRHVGRGGPDQGQVMAQVITSPGSRGFKAAAGLGRALMDRFAFVRSFVHSTRGGRADLAVGERRVLTLGPGFVEETVGDLRLRLSADSFFQTNTAQARALYQAAVDLAGLSGREIVLDLYCGVGGLSLFMARSAARVLGLDISPGAVSDAAANAGQNGLDNCSFMAADIESPGWSAKGLPGPDLVVCDPPRSGLGPRAVDALLELGPARVLAVSCDPAGLARDLARLAGAYVLDRVRVVDMFPHTAHVECLALLLKRPPA